MAKISKVLLVGHCGFDAGSLQSAVQGVAGGVPVEQVNQRAALDRQLSADTLLLVNRVLDGPLDARDGIDLISQLAEGDDAPKMMLISNYPDAQQQAQQAGALPGFGKSDLRDTATAEKLSEVIG